MERIYIQVNNTNYDDMRNYYTIDAWKTNDPNEQGKVVAVINATTADVWYIDQTARRDQLVVYAVKERVDAIKAKIVDKDFIIAQQDTMIKKLNNVIQQMNVAQNILLKLLRNK